MLLPNSLTRQYSLCGSTEDRSSYRIGVLRDPGSRGGSQFVHDDLLAGGTVRVRGPEITSRLSTPRNTCSSPAGSGITPMLPMISSAEEVGASWRLLYGAAKGLDGVPGRAGALRGPGLRYPRGTACSPVGSSRVRASQRRPHLQLRAWAVARRGGGRHGALAAGQPAQDASRPSRRGLGG